jgi:hypothetical protein
VGQGDRDKFERFLADTGMVAADNPAKRDALFREFLEWQKRNR